MERNIGGGDAPLIAIVGPTASGKTRLSLLLARRLNAEIVSADSRQIYKYLTIGTAKPSVEDRRQVPHHFIDVLDPRDTMSAGLFGKQAREVIGGIARRGKQALLVGGSGLYIKAVVDGLFDAPAADAEVRSWLSRRAKEIGLSGMLEDLRKVDPSTADRMAEEPKIRRIQRALEVYYATGVPLSAHVERQDRSQGLSVRFFGLEWARSKLNTIIDARVDEMMEKGFLDEVQWLQTHGYRPDLNALQTVGYKELFLYLAGGMTKLQAIESIKRNTRRFAKRQMTWFRAENRIIWKSLRHGSDFEQLADEIVHAVRA